MGWDYSFIPYGQKSTTVQDGEFSYGGRRRVVNEEHDFSYLHPNNCIASAKKINTIMHCC